MSIISCEKGSCRGIRLGEMGSTLLYDPDEIDSNVIKCDEVRDV